MDVFRTVGFTEQSSQQKGSVNRRKRAVQSNDYDWLHRFAIQRDFYAGVQYSEFRTRFSYSF